MQMCKMIISGIRREMMECNTLYEGLRGPLPVEPSTYVEQRRHRMESKK